MSAARAEPLWRGIAEPLVRGVAEPAADLLARSPAARRIALRALPRVLHLMFDPAMAAGVEETLALTVTDVSGRRGARYALLISGGELAVERRPAPEARLTMRARIDDLLRVASGRGDWPSMLSSGRLVMAGDPFLALRVPNILGLPVQSVSPRRT